MPVWLITAQAACCGPSRFHRSTVQPFSCSPSRHRTSCSSTSQPPVPFTMGQAREQRVAAAGGAAATVTWSYPAVSAMAPDVPRVSTLVALPSGTVTLASPGEGVPSSEPDGLCSCPGSGENLRAARLFLRGSPHQHHLSTRVHGNKCPPALDCLLNLHIHDAWRLHQLNHVSATRIAHRKESVSASTASPSAAKAKKSKRRKPRRGTLIVVKRSSFSGVPPPLLQVWQSGALFCAVPILPGESTRTGNKLFFPLVSAFDPAAASAACFQHRSSTSSDAATPTGCATSCHSRAASISGERPTDLE